MLFWYYEKTKILLELLNLLIVRVKREMLYLFGLFGKWLGLCIYKVMAVFEINKSNLIYNVKKIMGRLDEGVKLCAMIKADAYGHSSKIVADILAPYVDFFGVATISEGVDLRVAGCVTPILCVGKVLDFGEYKLASLYGIDVMVESWCDLQMIAQSGLPFNVHLKIDSGMHRLGYTDKNEFKKSLKIFKENEQLNLVGVFSHFAESEIDFYKNKLSSISEYLNDVRKYKKDAIIHISNSLASRHKFLQFGMVRVGLSLYGYGESGFKKVLRVKSKVVSIRRVTAGSFIGYGQGYKCCKDEIIATVFLGYYDGVNRKLGNNVYVKIKNKKYLVVGNICMDMFMVKVDSSVNVGDEVIVLDDASYWAEIVGTIPYEILTSIKSKRMEVQVVE